MTQKIKRKKIDWEKVEAEYRAGVLSVREIGRRCEVSDPAIRKKAKALGWERDLSAKIKTKVRSELVRSEVRTANPLKEKEIIEAAAAQGVAVVRGHQKRLGNAHKAVDLLMKQVTAAAKRGDDDMKSNAQVIANLTSSINVLIKLERQAFNIDDINNTETAPVRNISDDELDAKLIKLMGICNRFD